MSVLFFLIGFLVLLIGIPIMIVYAAKAYRLRRKGGKDSPALKALNKRLVKVGWTVIAALLTIAVSASFLPDEPAQDTSTVSVKQESERPAQGADQSRQPNDLTQANAPAALTGSEPQAGVKQDTQKPPDAEPISTPASAPEPQEFFIPGITSADIKLNLQKWGLEFGFDSGKAIDPDTGVELGATLYGDLPFQIKSLDFYVDGTAVIGMLPSESFLAVAGGYLGYCATLPYEGADPVSAREWVRNNVAKANQPGRPLETTFGPARYTLYGGKYIRHLSIEATTEGP